MQDTKNEDPLMGPLKDVLKRVGGAAFVFEIVAKLVGTERADKETPRIKALLDRGVADGWALRHGTHYEYMPSATQTVNPYADYSTPMEGSSHWDNHPDYPPEDWKADVAEDNTRQSYNEWVASCVEATREHDEIVGEE